MKKQPVRTCIGCGAEKTKKELIRIVRTPEGQILADPGGRMNGGGGDRWRDPECVRKAWKTKGLDRAFRETVARDVYERLEKELIDSAD